MFDLALNSNFSVHLDDRNDLATVEGRDAFEQSVVIRLTEFMNESLPGLTDGQTLKEKIRLEVSRVARDHDELDSIASLTISEKEDQPDTFTVQLVYESEQSFSTDIAAE
jgi:hypothetical protein